MSSTTPHNPTVFLLSGKTFPFKADLQAAGALFCGDAWLITAELADQYMGDDGLQIGPVKNKIALALDNCYACLVDEPSAIRNDAAFARWFGKLTVSDVKQAHRGASKGLQAVLREQLTAVVAHARKLGLDAEPLATLIA